MRASWLVGLLLGWSTVAQAGEQVFAWEYELALQPQVKYVLNIVSMQGEKPYQEERWVTPLSRAECRQYPIANTTDETQCLRTCLEPGSYSLKLFAVADGRRSFGSVPTLDMDFSTDTPCSGKPPSTTTPFPTAPVIAGVTVAGGAAAYAALQAREEVPQTIDSMLNLGCVTWRIAGPCVCGYPPSPCLQVEYWEPGWLVETSVRPGDTSLPGPFGSLVASALSAAGVTIGAGGSGNANSNTNMRFGDVHVISLPNLYGGPCSSCAPSGSPAVNYLSELDAPSWRVVPSTVNPLALGLQIGFWGPLYPRVGHVIHGSPVVASALQAVRGMNIAFNPVGVLPPPDAHVITTPTEGTSFCCQLASPRQTPCFTAGSPPPLFELSSGSVKGKYVYIFWRKKSCCVNPSQTTCGITLLGLKEPPQNTCLPLSTP